jgi:hypothetical protein
MPGAVVCQWPVVKPSYEAAPSRWDRRQIGKHIAVPRTRYRHALTCPTTSQGGHFQRRQSLLSCARREHAIPVQAKPVFHRRAFGGLRQGDCGGGDSFCQSSWTRFRDPQCNTTAKQQQTGPDIGETSRPTAEGASLPQLGMEHVAGRRATLPGIAYESAVGWRCCVTRAEGAYNRRGRWSITLQDIQRHRGKPWRLPCCGHRAYVRVLRTYIRLQYCLVSGAHRHRCC